MSNVHSIDITRIVSLHKPTPWWELGETARMLVIDACKSRPTHAEAAKALGISYRTLTRVRATMGMPRRRAARIQ